MSDDDDSTMAFSMGDKGRPSPQQSASLNGKLVCQDDSMLPERNKGLVIELSGKPVSIGRGEKNTLQIDIKKLSRNHCRVFPASGGWWVEDLGSTNGVWINNERVQKERMQPGQVVRFASVPFRFEIERPDIAVTASAKEESDADGGEDKTMMFGLSGSIKATDALLEAGAAEDDGVQEDEDETEPLSTSVSAQYMPAEDENKRNILGTLIKLLVFVGILCGGGYGIMMKMEADKRTEAIHHNSRAVARFINDFEDERKRFSMSDYQEQLEEIEKLSQGIEESIGQYPKLTALYVLKSHTVFLKFERSMRKLIERDKEPGRVDALADKTASQLKKLREKAGDEEQRGEAWSDRLANRVEPLIDLVKMGKIVAAFKQFATRYPEPKDKEATQPTGDVLMDLEDQRNRLATLKKRNHGPLAVTFSYFNRVVQGSDLDIQLTDRWRTVVSKKVLKK